MASTEPGFGVYVHWPFCARKCPYCDFNSHVRFGGWDEARFLEAYKRELRHVRARIGPREVSSIFFGGGTPSLMHPSTVAGVLDCIGSLWPVEPNAEVTLEANPGSVDAERFAGYRAAGVNRISIGVQSLRDDDLRRLGRIHSVADAKAAIEVARKTFERFSFDLIYARPEQRVDAWREELSEALEIAGRHLSLYQLTIEPETPFAELYARGRLKVPAAEDAHDLFEVTQELCEAAGLPSYEISNHAAPGEESRHNLLYWRYGEYAGVGPGAHGRLVFDGARHATSAERSPEAWLASIEGAGHGLAEVERLSRTAEADEMLLMGLRLGEGLDLVRLEAIGGVRASRSVLGELAAAQLIEAVQACDGEHGRGRHDQESGPAWRRIRATGRGRFILNELVLQISRSFEPM